MLKRFLSYYKPYKGLLAVDLLCALSLALVDLVFPKATQHAIDVIVPSGNARFLVMFGLGLLALYAVRAVIEYVVGFWGHVLGVRIQRDMRRDIFAHLQTLDFSFFDNTKTGQIMSRIVNDLFELGEISHHAPEDLLVATVRLVGSFVIMLTIEWRLALIVFCVVPVMFVFMLRFRGRFRNAFKTTKEKQAIINERIEESISGIRVVKAFTNEGYEVERFDSDNEVFYESRVITVRNIGLFSSGLGMLSNLALALVLVAGGLVAMKGGITAGSYVAFALFVTQFLQPLNVLLRFVEMYQDGAAGLRRFYEIMDAKPSITDAPDAVDLVAPRGAIRFGNVGFRYADGQERILHKVDLDVKPGETIAVVGPSGAGKTTLCSLLPRFYEIEEGSITVDGVDIRAVRLESLRRAIGLVQQDVFLFSGSIRDNILYGRSDATEEELRAAAVAANAHDFIMEFQEGYATIVGERGVKLSGGQKQRIAIARMFLKNPPILILDEATSSLDAKSEEIIRSSLERLSEGRTTFIIAHRLATIRHAKRIVVLTEDGVSEDGSHEELMARGGTYSELYKSQVDAFLLG